MTSSWERRSLGRTGLSVSAIGLGSNYGVSDRDVERAFERGINDRRLERTRAAR